MPLSYRWIPTGFGGRQPILGQTNEILQGPPEPVQPPHHHDVVGAELIKHLLQLRPLGQRARGLVGEHLQTPGRLQGIDLELGILVIGADPCVTNLLAERLADLNDMDRLAMDTASNSITLTG